MLVPDELVQFGHGKILVIALHLVNSLVSFLMLLMEWFPSSQLRKTIERIRSF